MSNPTPHDANTHPSEKPAITHTPQIPAEDVGVTLRVSDAALKEVDRLQQAALQAVQDGRKYSWR